MYIPRHTRAECLMSVVRNSCEYMKIKMACYRDSILKGK